MEMNNLTLPTVPQSYSQGRYCLCNGQMMKREFWGKKTPKPRSGKICRTMGIRTGLLNAKIRKERKENPEAYVMEQSPAIQNLAASLGII